MSPLRVLRGLMFGGIGGFLAWVLSEFLPLPYPFMPARYEGPGMTPPNLAPEQMAFLGLVLGLCIGGFLGVAEGIAAGTTSRFFRSFWTFALLGAVGGYLGVYCGQLIYGVMGGRWGLPRDTGEFFKQIFARSFGWMLIGLFIGVVFGIPNNSARRMWNGAVGGALGGALGGFFFQAFTSAGLFVGMQGRLVGFTMVGAVIGFFINLIAEAMKRSWVKVLIGRNEGREYVLDTPVAYVGRDELADIPVFLDPMVPRRIASFRQGNGRYALYPESDAMPILINGQPLAPGHALSDGDAIQFGRITLGYFEKATATGGVRPVDNVPLADYSQASVVPGAMPLPTNPGVCQFCGQTKDPSTGACACTVPGDGGYAPEGPGGYSPGFDPAGYGVPAAAAAPPGPGGWGAPVGQDAAYAATMLDPGTGAGYAPMGGGGPRLVVVSGPYAGQIFPLSGIELGIGREPTQEIPLPQDGTASRRHARVLPSNGGWLIHDEGSANGTWVNGVRVQDQPLFPGDTIRIGQSELRFEM